MIQYKGYVGNVEIDEDRGVLFGTVVNTRDVITYEGRTVAELTRAFHESVDDYLEFCQERGEAPEKPFSGNFQVRITPDLHREVHAQAALSGMSLNRWVADNLRSAVERGHREVVRTRSARKKPQKGKKADESPSS
jgi:predicted HicB family RNase H-like nuclease